MSIFFTADHHFCHSKISGYCGRPWNTVEEMNEGLIAKWNAKVKDTDTVYYLGDFAMSNPAKYLARLNGHIHFIFGSHDGSTEKLAKKSRGYYVGTNNNGFGHAMTLDNVLERDQKIIKAWKKEWANDRDLGPEYAKKTDVLKAFYYTRDQVIQLKGLSPSIVLSHHAMRSWPRSYYGSWHLYGHCLDLQTEVLTNHGWKYRPEINHSDQVMTLNLNSGNLEYNVIKEFIDISDYCGEVYTIKSKGLDVRVTGGHTMITIDHNGRYRKTLACDMSKKVRHRFIKSGVTRTEKNVLPEDNNMIRLMIWIAADGNLCNSDLVRIRVLKSRKIKAIENLLLSLGIKFTIRPQKDSSVSFNFNIPHGLKKYSLRPLDISFRNCNLQQLETVIETYSQTDGHQYGKTTAIWTSKKEESDIIQEACVKNGYQCNINIRNNHGFSKKDGYTLMITEGQYRYVGEIDKHIAMSIVDKEYFWCLSVKNETLFIRKNGKPVIIGNSHGKLPSYGLSFDVGVDCPEWDYAPVSYEQVKHKMGTLGIKGWRPSQILIDDAKDYFEREYMTTWPDGPGCPYCGTWLVSGVGCPNMICPGKPEAITDQWRTKCLDQ